jgi:hypothetical protein
VAVLHLNPDGLIAEVCADLEKDRVVKVDGCSKESFAVIVDYGLPETIHKVSPN